MANRLNTVLQCIFEYNEMNRYYFQRIYDQSNYYAQRKMERRNSTLYYHKWEFGKPSCKANVNQVGTGLSYILATAVLPKYWPQNYIFNSGAFGRPFHSFYIRYAVYQVSFN